MNCHDLILTSECHKVSELQRLIDIMAHLRGPDGCPWDQEQTHQTLTRCLVEEVSETLEAIDNNDMVLLEEELGDLLLQVVFHAQIAREKEKFDLEDVARGISDKLIRRHPHVFGDEQGTIKEADKVVDRWEQIKAAEKKQKGLSEQENLIFKKLPPRLPALLFAYDIFKKAEKAGVTRDMPIDLVEIQNEARDFDEEKAGLALFEIVAICRKAGLDPETVFNAIKGGLAGSNVMNTKAPMMYERNFKPGFRIELHLKDITNAMETANEMQIPLQVTSNLHQVLKSLVLDGKGVDDHSGILKFVEKQSGVEVKK